MGQQKLEEKWIPLVGLWRHSAGLQSHAEPRFVNSIVADPELLGALAQRAQGETMQCLVQHLDCDLILSELNSVVHV